MLSAEVSTLGPTVMPVPNIRPPETSNDARHTCQPAGSSPESRNAKVSGVVPPYATWAATFCSSACVAAVGGKGLPPPAAIPDRESSAHASGAYSQATPEP